MVRSLKLLDFKSHKNSKLEFCSGINGIVGISQSGKTNILRAIKMLVELKSKSKYIARNGRDNYSITLETFDNHVVELQKGIVTIDNEKKYRKFGRQIPEVRREVEKVLLLSDINFHSQFDDPFLIFSRPSEISKTINETTGMEEFDNWIKETNDRIRSVKNKKKYHEETVIEAERDLEALDGLEDIDPILSEAHKVRKKRLQMQAKYDSIKHIADRLERIKYKIEEQKQTEKLKPIAAGLIEIKREKAKLILRVEIINEYLDTKDNIEDLNRSIERMTKEYIRIIKRTKKCPMCFSPINSKTIERLKNEIHSVK